VSNGIGIVGGGLLGLGLADRLSAAGVKVTVYESSPQLGGLAGSTELGGVRVDRFYHAVTTTDQRVLDLAQELGVGIRWRRLGGGFYHEGRTAEMSTPAQLLTFPGLSPADRARLVRFVLRCRRIEDHSALDRVPLEAWTRRTCGDRLWERLWEPLFDSKFDGHYADLPATYLWSRMNRVSGTRDRKGHEVMGALDGGYQNLVDRLAERIRARGGQVLTSTAVRFVPCAEHRAIGVVLDAGFRPHDTVVMTQIRPNLPHVLAPELEQALGPDRQRYLGIVCLVARLRRSVSPYYALNITDRRVPLTSVVETTHVVDPAAAEGHLVYLPKYVNPDSPELGKSSAEITKNYFGHLKTMFPSFTEEDVIASQVARARVAEPVHPVGAVKPDPFAVPGLVVASSAQVYPDIVHGQAILGVADRIAAELSARLPVSQRRLEAA
jgi:protoporphyrinogen oxidase